MNEEQAGTRGSGSPSSSCARGARARSPLRVSLGVLVILFYIVTLVKGPGVLVRPL